jgi:hypothetical protein
LEAQDSLQQYPALYVLTNIRKSQFVKKRSHNIFHVYFCCAFLIVFLVLTHNVACSVFLPESLVIALCLFRFYMFLGEGWEHFYLVEHPQFGTMHERRK